jgi:amino acid adenylation domain-containing protein
MWSWRQWVLALARKDDANRRCGDEMRVERFLADSAWRFPDKTAIVAGTERVTYGELERAAGRIAASLAEGGVGRGDRVVVFMDNCWQTVAACFAVLRAGAVFSPVNPSTKAEKLAYILANCEARAVVTHAKLLPVARSAAARAPSVTVMMVAGCGPDDRPAGAVRIEDVLAHDGPAPAQPGIDLDLAMLIYTSGSTGTPKGVMMTHQNVVAAADSVIGYLGNSADDVIFNLLPLSFNYGLYQALTAARVGATLVLDQSFAFPRTVFRKMAEERVTGFPIVPTIAALILQMRDLEPGSLPDLRYMTNAAAALSPAHLTRLRALFPTTAFYSMYGLTECKRCTWLPPAELDARPTSVGIPIPGTEAWVADDLGNPVPPGTVGELVVRGAHVMKGYWNDPQATDRALRPGPLPLEKVLHTGDLFRADEDGYLYFVARKDDVIKTRGEKVSPVEVENAIHALPEVREAVVVGVPDPILGQAIHAVVVAEVGACLTEQAVIRHCAGHLEDFMVPRSVEFRDSLPKTDTGKIKRSAIASEFLEATP